ncbi:Sad1-interacting factor 3 [Malassezia psittaci]|uniref:Sad1-interacting factor 3 n=1 Tax=Malassezia psittaci TaxID=1821823 RepID=A0AAF0JEA3_9BASI|nr:Sad1-interacting factor 3 [Malassezia psittaci]
MAQRPPGGSANRGTNAAPSGARHSTPLPGISDTVSMMRSRRANNARPSNLEDLDDFEVETPGDAALHELPSGIIMPGVKSTRPKDASVTSQAPDGSGSRPNTTIKAPATSRAPYPRAAPPKLASNKGISPATSSGLRVAGASRPPSSSQPKGTPARVQRYSLPVRAEKPVRTSKVSGRHVLLPSESQLAPLPDRPKDQQGDEDESDDDDDDDEGASRVVEPRMKPSAPPRGSRRKGPVYYTFERMPPRDRITTKLPRLTSYAISNSIHIPTLLGFVRREHGVRPRLYEECAYILYFKPLLPGFGRSSIRSSREPRSGSPGAESRHEREIVAHEESGYVGSYFEQHDEQANFDNDGYIQGGERSGGAPDASSPLDESAPSETIGLDKILSDTIAGDAQAPSPTSQNNFDPTQADRAGARDMMLQENAERTEELREQSDPPPKSMKKLLRINQASHTYSGEENEHAPTSIQEALNVGEVIVLPYGVVVMYNFTEAEEQSIIEDVMASGSVRMPHRMYDQELFHFCYDPDVPSPRIYNDFFTFRAPNHLLKLSLAHAIAQSTKLSEFEESMHRTLELTSHIPRELAQTGELGVNRRGALRMSGHLFKLRVDVNLTSDVLDTPDLFWSEASLQALYDAIREYLEIDQRAQTLNERLAVANDLLEIIHEHLNNNAMSKITWVIIALIVAACIVALGEISARLIVTAKLRHNETTMASNLNFM